MVDCLRSALRRECVVSRLLLVYSRFFRSFIRRRQCRCRGAQHIQLNVDIRTYFIIVVSMLMNMFTVCVPNTVNASQRMCFFPHLQNSFLALAASCWHSNDVCNCEQMCRHINQQPTTNAIAFITVCSRGISIVCSSSRVV